MDPKKKAAADYLAIVTPINSAIDGAERQYDHNGISWADEPKWCAALDGGEEVFARRISAHWWPPAARSAAGSIAADDAALAGLLYQCAAAPGTASAQQTLATQISAAEDKANNDASAMRVALGLPVKR